MKNYLIRAVDVKSAAKDAEARKMTFVASDGSRDSYGTVLNPEHWDLERFNNNPIIGYQHKVYGGWEDTQNPDNVIGKGRAYVDGDKLMVDVEFEPAEINELADKVWKKLQWGSLNGVSVGFVPKGKGFFGPGDQGPGEPNETYYYAGQELVEISVVNIPSNPNALKNAMQDEVDRLAEERKAALEEKKPKPEPEPKEDEAEKARAAAEAEKEKTVTIAEAALQIL